MLWSLRRIFPEVKGRPAVEQCSTETGKVCAVIILSITTYCNTEHSTGQTDSSERRTGRSAEKSPRAARRIWNHKSGLTRGATGGNLFTHRVIKTINNISYWPGEWVASYRVSPFLWEISELQEADKYSCLQRRACLGDYCCFYVLSHRMHWLQLSTRGGQELLCIRLDGFNILSKLYL